MKVFVGCEYSGTVRDAFLRRGHDAVSCDIRPTNHPGPHLKGDVMQMILKDKWDLAILHPECRKVCLSGNHVYAYGKPKYRERIEAAIWIEQLWLTARGQARQVCLENSKGVLNELTVLGPPSQSIQPYQFGHDASKETCFWLHNLPKLIPTKPIPPRWVCCEEILPKGLAEPCLFCNGQNKAKPVWSNQTNSGQNNLGPNDSRSDERARTFWGIAEAMAEQWSN